MTHIADSAYETYVFEEMVNKLLLKLADLWWNGGIICYLTMEQD